MCHLDGHRHRSSFLGTGDNEKAYRLYRIAELLVPQVGRTADTFREISTVAERQITVRCPRHRFWPNLSRPALTLPNAHAAFRALHLGRAIFCNLALQPVCCALCLPCAVCRVLTISLPYC